MAEEFEYIAFALAYSLAHLTRKSLTHYSHFHLQQMRKCLVSDHLKYPSIRLTIIRGEGFPILVIKCDYSLDSLENERNEYRDLNRGARQSLQIDHYHQIRALSTTALETTIIYRHARVAKIGQQPTAHPALVKERCPLNSTFAKKNLNRNGENIHRIFLYTNTEKRYIP